MDHESNAALEKPDLYRLYEEKIAEIAGTHSTLSPVAEDAPLTWCLAYTAPLQERLAEYWLLESGFDVFIPTWIYRHRRRRDIVEKELPLFRNYVFVGDASRAPRYAQIEETTGVLDLVRISGVPVVVPTAIVDDLMAACEMGCFAMNERTGMPQRVTPGTPPEQLARFRIGDKARVAVGPETLIGRIASAPAKERISVLLTFFGVETEISAPLDAVEPLTQDCESDKGPATATEAR